MLPYKTHYPAEGCCSFFNDRYSYQFVLNYLYAKPNLEEKGFRMNKGCALFQVCVCVFVVFMM